MLNEKQNQNLFAAESTEPTGKTILWVRARLRCVVAAALAVVFGVAELRLRCARND